MTQQRASTSFELADVEVSRGLYRARLAQGAADIAACQALRVLCFGLIGADEAEVDDICRHMMIEDAQTGALVCGFRMKLLQSGADVAQSYSAQFYDLAKLQRFEGRMLELGRFCIHPNYDDPDILRLAWGALTGVVDRFGVRMLFGCASFVGAQADVYRDALALLKLKHVAPEHWRPAVKAPDIVCFAELGAPALDTKAGLEQMPSLLRTYLSMGGWVSDHAVVDQEMNTLHVFTGVEIATIPAARKDRLRAVAG